VAANVPVRITGIDGLTLRVEAMGSAPGSALGSTKETS
jgi:hypothetical protein